MDFPGWFSGIFTVSLSLNDFVIINSIGFTATIIIVVFYTFNKSSDFIVAALGTFFFVNGIAHIVTTVFTFSYSPGTITAVLLYLPLGYLVYKKISLFFPDNIVD
jgi:hypothetical protein